jgi:hypothetical protein
MFRRNALHALALAIGTLAVSAAPARAIPTGNTLSVIAYYSDASKTQLVGQKWSGCGQPSGSWGTTTPHVNLFFPAC